MSDTPRTDEEEDSMWSEGNQGMRDGYAEKIVSANFARKLERELALVSKSLADARECLKIQRNVIIHHEQTLRETSK